MGQHPHASTARAEGGATYQSVCAWLLVTVIPAISKGMGCYPFAAVGLHYRSSGWVLWHLGVTNFVAYLSRNLTHSLVAKIGSWFAMPVSVVRTLLLVPSMIFPDSEAATMVSLVAYWVLEPELGLQGLCHGHFKGNYEALMQAARVQSLSSTLGIALSPLMCGLAFDFGGWQLVSVCGFASQAVTALMLCVNPLVYKDWRASRQRESAGDIALDDLERGSSDKGRSSLSSLPRALFLPGLMTALANFANHYSYQTEWVTFAIYFRDEHNWTNSAMAAFFQMIGDVIGAIVLLAAMRKTKKRRRWLPRVLTDTFSQPFNISWLLVAWAVLNFGMAAPNLYVAIAAQIAMGTVCVFCIQYITEMNMALAGGDSSSYLILQLMCSVFYSIACAISGSASLVLYESMGPLAPFYLSTGLCVCCALAHAAYFVLKGMPNAADMVTNAAEAVQKEELPNVKAEEYTHVPNYVSEDSLCRPTSRQGPTRARWNHILNDIVQKYETCDGRELGDMPLWVDSSARFRKEIVKVADAIFEQEAARSENLGANERPRTNRYDRRYHTIDVGKSALEHMQESDSDLSPGWEPDMEPVMKLEADSRTVAKAQSHQPTVNRSLPYQPDIGKSQSYDLRQTKNRAKSRKSMPSRLLRPWSSRVWRDLEMEKPADTLTRGSFGDMISQIPDLDMEEEAIDLIFDTLDGEQSGIVLLKSFTDVIASLAPRSPEVDDVSAGGLELGGFDIDLNVDSSGDDCTIRQALQDREGLGGAEESAWEASEACRPGESADEPKTAYPILQVNM